MNRKRATLGGLLAVLAVCLVYAYLATPRLEKAPPREGQPRTQAVDREASAEEQGEPGRRIDFSYLESTPQEVVGAQRDIFRFHQRRPVRTDPAPPVVRVEPPKPVVMPEVVPVAVVQKALSQFTFLGFLEKAGEKTVFLSSGGDLYLAGQGERFGANREFLVEQIDDQVLKVRHADRAGLIEVRLIEKQKLDAAVSAPVSVPRSADPAVPTGSTRVLRPQPRGARPVAVPQEQDFQGGVRQEDQEFQGDIQQGDQGFLDGEPQEYQGFPEDAPQEDQVLQGDGNFWPAKQR